MTDTQADLTERARAVLRTAQKMHLHEPLGGRNLTECEVASIAAALQSEREAAAAEARRVADDTLVALDAIDAWQNSRENIAERLIVARARLSALASPAPQERAAPTKPCYCDETQCYSANVQPGWHCKKQAQIASPATQEETR